MTQQTGSTVGAPTAGPVNNKGRHAVCARFARSQLNPPMHRARVADQAAFPPATGQTPTLFVLTHHTEASHN